MAVRLRISGLDKTTIMQVNTLQVASRLNARNRSSFRLADVTGAYRPSIGAEVILDSGENRLLYTNDPDNAAWTLYRVTLSQGLPDPQGGRLAFTITETAVTDEHGYYQTYTSAITTYTLSGYFKDAGRRYISLNGQGGGTAYAIFDLQTGTITGTGGANYTSSAIANVGGGWYRCSLVYASVSVVFSYALYQLTNSGTVPNGNYLGTGQGITAYGLQLQQGSDLGPFAETGAAAVTGLPRYFGGFVDSVNEELTIDGNTSSLSHDVECVSYDAIADRRLVAASYESGSQTLSTIAVDVVTNFLTGDGVTTTNVDTGPIIDRVKFNYVPASSVFNELANITGYAWWIDESKALWFKPRSGVTGSVSIDSSNCRDVRVTRTLETYRNKQLIRAGVALTSSRTENFSGNGTQKAWTLAYPVGAAPTITVGGVGKTVGIRGVDTGKDWYYNLADPVINQDDGAAAVGAGVAIAVTYQGQYPILINAQNDAQIASQAALGGTAGVYEQIEERANLNDDGAASDIASGLLRRYGKVPRRVTFVTEMAGLAAGQLINITLTPHGISGTWLVDSVTAQDRNGRDLVWTVEALDGESVGGWVEFFAALSRQGATAEFRENEVIIYLRALAETVSLTDTLTATSAAPESRVGFAKVDQSEVGV